jgi:hypothetical protein
MARKTSMGAEGRAVEYHDAHLDDPEEWDEASAEHVEPRPSGMTVFSLRLPNDEFRYLKTAAEERHTTMSELTRTALRFYLMPRATGSLSTTAVQVMSVTPIWVGGVGERLEVHPKTPPVLGPLGNVVPA